jgi:hypothetical protein
MPLPLRIHTRTRTHNFLAQSLSRFHRQSEAWLLDTLALCCVFQLEISGVSQLSIGTRLLELL